MLSGIKFGDKEKKHKHDKHRKKEEEKRDRIDVVETKNLMEKNVMERENWMMAPPSNLFEGKTKTVVAPVEVVKEVPVVVTVQEKEKKLEPIPIVGDGGLALKKKALAKAEATARETGASMDDLLRDRFGSEAELRQSIYELEKQLNPKKERRNSTSPKRSNRHHRSRSPIRNRDRSRSRSPRRNKERRLRSRSPLSPKRDKFRAGERSFVYNSDKPSVSYKGKQDDSLSWRTDAPAKGNWRDRISSNNVIENKHVESEKSVISEDDFDATAIDLNKVKAQALKAKMSGQTLEYERLSKIVEKAQTKLKDVANNSESLEKDSEENVVVLSTMDDKGRLRTQLDGTSLKSLKERERLMDSQDNEMLYANIYAKNKGLSSRDTDDQFDAAGAEMFDTKPKDPKKEEAKQMQRQINQDLKVQKLLDTCWYCFASPVRKESKHLIISLGESTYLALPEGNPLVPNHCFITTLDHAISVTEMEDDCRQEIFKFKEGLVKMFAKQHHGCLFLETTQAIDRRRHTIVECIPVPREEFLDAPIYFKKAILETDEEWATHKKLIDSRGGKPISQLIPPNFPYFHVEFGLDGGFAHIIEDNEQFPVHFGKNVICGILDEPAEILTRYREQTKAQQWNRVQEFLKLWKPFDWTVSLD